MNYRRFKKMIVSLALMCVFALPMAMTFTPPAYAQSGVYSDVAQWRRYGYRHPGYGYRGYYRYPGYGYRGYYGYPYGGYYRRGYYNPYYRPYYRGYGYPYGGGYYRRGGGFGFRFRF